MTYHGTITSFLHSLTRPPYCKQVLPASWAEILIRDAVATLRQHMRQQSGYSAYALIICLVLHKEQNILPRAHIPIKPSEEGCTQRRSNRLIRIQAYRGPYVQ